jgi:tetratricopeptide (TPR) repeat protein
MLARVLAGFIRRNCAASPPPSTRDREWLFAEARALFSADNFGAAEELLRELLRNGESDAEAHRLLGTVLGASGRTDEAREVLERARSLDPDNADGLVLLGHAYRFSGRFADAEGCYRHALAMDPSTRAAAFGVANCAESAGLSEAAKSGYVALLEPPAFVPALYALIGLLLRLGRVEEAKLACTGVLRGEPEHGAAQACLGFLLLNRELNAQEALEHFEHALQAGYRDQEILANRDVARGIVFQDLGQLDAAVASYDAALLERPDYPLARFHRSLALLLRGEFGRGWPDYEARLMSEAALPPPKELPRWKGEDLSESTLLVYGEQGIGDEIMFASCLPDLVHKCPKVVLACAAKLEPIMRRSFPQVNVLSLEAARRGGGEEFLEQATVMSAIGSLPHYLRPTLAHFPRHNGYLRADPVLVARYRERLQALGPGPKVGISWRGGSVQSRKALRSLGRDQVAAILGISGIRFISLQYDSVGAEPEIGDVVRSGRLMHWSNALDDYDHTAALVSCLDVVVSVCTAVIHLAGALGRPVWVLAPFSPEWRYGISGPRMPWYPSAEVIRQHTRGDWSPVIEVVCTRLQASLI